MLTHRFTPYQVVSALYALTYKKEEESKLCKDWFDGYSKEQIKAVRHWLQIATNSIALNQQEFEHLCRKINKIQE